MEGADGYVEGLSTGATVVTPKFKPIFYLEREPNGDTWLRRGTCKGVRILLATGSEPFDWDDACKLIDVCNELEKTYDEITEW